MILIIRNSVQIHHTKFSPNSSYEIRSNVRDIHYKEFRPILVIFVIRNLVQFQGDSSYEIQSNLRNIHNTKFHQILGLFIIRNLVQLKGYLSIEIQANFIDISGYTMDISLKWTVFEYQYLDASMFNISA